MFTKLLISTGTRVCFLLHFICINSFPTNNISIATLLEELDTLFQEECKENFKQTFENFEWDKIKVKTCIASKNISSSENTKKNCRFVKEWIRCFNTQIQKFENPWEFEITLEPGLMMNEDSNVQNCSSILCLRSIRAEINYQAKLILSYEMYMLPIVVFVIFTTCCCCLWVNQYDFERLYY